MSDQDKRLSELESGAAILATCIVQTINESDSTFQDRFLERLSVAYRESRDNPGPHDGPGTLEILAWTRELLTGFNHVTGQGEPFLGD